MPMVVSARANRFMGMEKRAVGFATRAPDHAQGAARTATETSRMIYSRWHSGRPLAPPRPGRPTTEGAFATLLNWNATPQGMVEFDVAEIEGRAPYWIIQEIGTGQEARILSMGGSGVSVRSQSGRALPYGFYWGDGVGSVSAGDNTRQVGLNPTRNVSERGRKIPAPFRSPGRKVNSSGLIGQQNLYPIGMTPPGRSFIRATGIIHREIIGKHFVRDGGYEGWTVLHDALMVDFRDTFR